MRKYPLIYFSQVWLKMSVSIIFPVGVGCVDISIHSKTHKSVQRYDTVIQQITHDASYSPPTVTANLLTFYL